MLRLRRNVREQREVHRGPQRRLGDISIYGQESNYTTWWLAKMNLAIRGIDAQIAHGDTFHNDRHPDLKADWVMANPPFNDSDWRGDLLKGDKRWVYGVPPAGKGGQTTIRTREKQAFGKNRGFATCNFYYRL